MPGIGEALTLPAPELNGGPVAMDQQQQQQQPNATTPSSTTTEFAVSPVTHEMIPVNEMAEHMRIALIDPKYKEQKEKMMAKLRESTLASDDEILHSLMGLWRLRPDIFGTTE